ncbi:hypothetical protein E2C01_031730 [Portunus trituberculatus]|uniref:Uncharacterized protein n=1 Tax=Portunus trituberculatus TaxID=210409 RepID=A0A5B7EXN8_PORTR|nr:hypothetical protein [Portunus trituberculatus]
MYSNEEKKVKEIKEDKSPGKIIKNCISNGRRWEVKKKYMTTEKHCSYHSNAELTTQTLKTQQHFRTNQHNVSCVQQIKKTATIASHNGQPTPLKDPMQN